MNNDVWYRVHWSDCPAFNADNAWSALWGLQRSEDGTQVLCNGCDGTGEDLGDPGESCPGCKGTGWLDCEPGYSCAAAPGELVEYFGHRGGADGETVIVFTGHQTGTGADGEPLVVPDEIIETMTWEKFQARHQES